MKGDFSKFKDIGGGLNSAGVMYQQGRPFSDADANAQGYIDDRRHVHAAQDVIGRWGAYYSVNERQAFKVRGVTVDGTGALTVQMGQGRGWINGWEMYNPQAPTAAWSVTRLGPTAVAPVDKDRDLVLLEVWREPVSSFQRLELMEPALGGVDTSLRLQNCFRLRSLRLTAADDPRRMADKLKDIDGPRGRMKAYFRNQTPPGTGECPTFLDNGYSGFEHSLFRIEIASRTATDTYFKWSRHNGSLLARVAVDTTSSAQDILFPLRANQAAVTLSGLTRAWCDFLKVEADGSWSVVGGIDVVIDRGNLRAPKAALNGFVPQPEADGTCVVRLWNGRMSVNTDLRQSNGLLVDNICLEFDATNARTFFPGDYWTFTVRAGGLTTSLDQDFRDPEGIDRSYVPLACVTWSSSSGTLTPSILDLRKAFRPLGAEGECCSFTVGDGVVSFGDFDSLEEAVQELPEEGGELCLLPGHHLANLALSNKQNIAIRACSNRVSVCPRPENMNGYIFQFNDCQGISIEGITATSLNGGIVTSTRSQKLKITRNRFLAYLDAIYLERVTDSLINENSILILDRDQAGYALNLQISNTLVQNNVLTLFADPINVDDPKQPGKKVNVLDPCTDFNAFYQTPQLIGIILGLWARDTTKPAPNPDTRPLAQGGLRILENSSYVRIYRNKIYGGAAHGITLGGLPPNSKPSSGYVLENIDIRDCEIAGMSLSGIGSSFPTLAAGMTRLTPQDILKLPPGVDVPIFAQLSIRDTNISDCLLADSSAELLKMLDLQPGGGISLGFGTGLSIRNVMVSDCAPNHQLAACGIALFYGEQVTIEKCVLRGNGRTEATPNTQCAGIIAFVGSGLFGSIGKAASQGAPADDTANFTVSIAQNNVEQTGSRALDLVGLGNFRVTGNRFASVGGVGTASAVRIMNISLPSLMVQSSDESYSQIQTSPSDTSMEIIG